MSDLPQKQRMIVQAADEKWSREFEVELDMVNREGTRIIQNIQSALTNLPWHDDQYTEILMEVIASMARGNARQGRMMWKTKLQQFRQMVKRHSNTYPGAFD
jgi:Zn-dependent M16 (insulinase) family peptidase